MEEKMTVYNIDIKKLKNRDQIIKKVKDYASSQIDTFGNNKNRSIDDKLFHIEEGYFAELLIQAELKKHKCIFYVDNYIKYTLDKSDSFDLLSQSGLTFDIKTKSNKQITLNGKCWYGINRYQAGRRHVDYYILTHLYNYHGEPIKDIEDAEILSILGFVSGKELRKTVATPEFIKNKRKIINPERGNYIVSYDNLSDFNELIDLFKPINSNTKLNKQLIVMPKSKLQYVKNKLFYDTENPAISDIVLNNYKNSKIGLYDRLTKHKNPILSGFDIQDFNNESFIPYTKNVKDVLNQPSIKVGKTKPHIDYRTELIANNCILSFSLNTDNQVDFHVFINQVIKFALKYNLSVNLKNIQLTPEQYEIIKNESYKFNFKIL